MRSRVRPARRCGRVCYYVNSNYGHANYTYPIEAKKKIYQLRLTKLNWKYSVKKNAWLIKHMFSPGYLHKLGKDQVF